MKKTIISMAVAAIAALGAQAQTTYTVQRACHPDDVKNYDTKQLRERFMMPTVMEQDKINLTYSMYDRLIFGGTVPVTKVVELETIDPLKADYFLERRELGVINIGGPGVVKSIRVQFREDLQGLTIEETRAYLLKADLKKPSRILAQGAGTSLGGARQGGGKDRRSHRQARRRLQYPQRQRL